MNHKPFEEWLLSDDDLTPEEDQALREHLQTCDECPQIESAWKEVQFQLETAPQIGPTPGFTERWEARLAAERAHQQHKLVLRVLLFTILGAAASAGVLLVQNWSDIPTPLGILAGFAYIVSSFMAGVQDLSVFIRILTQTLPPAVSIGIWIAISSTLVVWIGIWLLTVWKLPFFKRSLT